MTYLLLIKKLPKITLKYWSIDGTPCRDETDSIGVEERLAIKSADAVILGLSSTFHMSPLSFRPWNAGPTTATTAKYGIS